MLGALDPRVQTDCREAFACSRRSRPCSAQRSPAGVLCDDAMLLHPPRFEQSPTTSAGRNPDADLQRHVRPQGSHCCNQLQAGLDRPLGIVLMGLGINKIHKHTVVQNIAPQTRRSRARSPRRIFDRPKRTRATPPLDASTVEPTRSANSR